MPRTGALALGGRATRAALAVASPGAGRGARRLIDGGQTKRL